MLSTPNTHEAEARRHALRGEYEEALTHLAALKQGVSADLLSSVGFVSMRLGLVDVADRYLRRALELDDKNVGALKNLAELLLSQPALDAEVETLLQRATQLYPEDSELKILDARRRHRLSGMDGVRDIMVAVLRDPDLAVQVLAIKALLDFECWEEVVSRARANLHAGQHHPYLYDYLGQALLRQGHVKAADNAYEKADRRFHDRAFALIGRARVALARSDHSAARALLEQVLQRIPEHAEASHLYWNLLAVELCWTQLETATRPFVLRDPPVMVAIGYYVMALQQTHRWKQLGEFTASLEHVRQ